MMLPEDDEPGDDDVVDPSAPIPPASSEEK